MTLRRRLTLLVALAVVIPITAVGVTVANLIGGELERRTFDRLRQAADFGRAELAERQDRIVRESATLADGRVAGLTTQTAAARRDALRDILRDEDVDFLILADAEGAVVTSARREAQFAGGFQAPTDDDLVSGSGSGAALLARAPLGGADAQTATLTVGIWLDNVRLDSLFRSSDVAYSIVADGAGIAATAGGVTGEISVDDGPDRMTIGGQGAFVVATDVPGSDSRLLAIAGQPQNVWTNLGVILALLIAMLVVAIVLVGHVVAGLVTGPVQELVDAANEVSRGDLDQRVEPGKDAEVAALGVAFNRMTDNLRDHVRQLETSRKEFRQAIDRLGDVLVSTHEKDGIVEVVLEMSTLILRGEQAIFYDRVAMPARIRAAAAHGAGGDEAPDFELNASGVAGTAALHMRPAVSPGVHLDPAEPAKTAAIAVPVRSGGRLEGVLAVYGREGGGTFGEEDVETLATLARQTEVAIGNLKLYEETQRQARTDGMTGLYNRREFELRGREFVRDAQRFHDPFGVIIVDADDFKDVNDQYDHLTGDAALIWVASQLSVATREVDIVARWGGEEFTVLLPRTGPEETAIVAERIRALVAREPLVHEGHNISLTVSVGYACYPEDGQTADALFRAADIAMLRAKRLGKNRVERARIDNEETSPDDERDQGGDNGRRLRDPVPSGEQGDTEGDAADSRQTVDPVRGGGGSPSRTA